MIYKLDQVLELVEQEATKITKFEQEIQSLKKERDRYKNLVIAVGNTIPDLMWAKDLEGKYLYANSNIREVLFYNMDKSAILGKTDIEISKICKDKVGNDKHTFGEKCRNSDLVVLSKLTKQKFLEYGLVDGKEVYLEVHKAPFYNADGKLLGTVGTGRDVTGYYLGLKEAIRECNSSICINRLNKELDKYLFEG
jgi:PAS domain-containing protein